MEYQACKVRVRLELLPHILRRTGAAHTPRRVRTHPVKHFARVDLLQDEAALLETHMGSKPTRWGRALC